VADAEDWGMRKMCYADDPDTCDHEHLTLWDFDPVLASLSDAIERNGIKLGGVRYDLPSE
jgi:hypothetical protein